jgi:hypothetical protein
MRISLVFAALLFWQTGLLAEDAKAVKGGQAVQELLELTSARQQYQQMLMGMGQGIQGGFTISLAKALKDRPLDQASKTKGKAILDRHHQEFIKKLQQALQQTLSWDSMVKDVYIPVYLKHFSEAELQDILTFYTSKTGRKFASKGPDLLKDVSKEVNRRYAKQIKASTDKLADEQIGKITSEIDALRAGAKKAP